MNFSRADSLALQRAAKMLPLGDAAPQIHGEAVILRAIYAVRRRWRLLACIVLAGLVAASAFLLLTPVEYRAESVIRIDFGGGRPATTNLIPLEAGALVEGEARFLHTRQLAGRVVERLGLSDDPEFGTSRVSAILKFFGLTKSLTPKSTSMTAPNTTAQSAAVNQSVAQVMAHTTVQNDSKSYLITVQFRSASATKAVAIANALTMQYLQVRAIEGLRSAAARAYDEVQELSRTFGKDHPKLLEASARLADVEAQIAAVEKETRVGRAVRLDQYTITQSIPAEVRNAYVSPRVRVAFPLALVVSLGGGILLILLLERRDTGFVSEQEISDTVALRCFGMVPALPAVRADAIRPLIAEAVKAVAVSMGLDARSGACTTVVVTSALHDEGKSLFSAELASALSDVGKRVLFIDAMPNASGVGNLAPPVAGSDDIRKASLRPKSSMTPYEAVQLSDPNFVLCHNSFEAFLSNVRSNYDVILVKAAPIMLTSAAMQLARLCDLTILLASWRRTPRSTVMSAIRRLSQGGAEISGIVLTGVDLKAHAYDGIHDQSYYLNKYRTAFSSDRT